MLTVLHRRNFTLLWLGGLISMLGDWALIAALPYYIYERTGSALASGAILITYTVPALLLGSAAGVFVDRWDRKRVMVVSNMLQSVAVLCLLLVRSDDWLWVVYAVALMQSSLATFFGPAEHSLLPHLVDEEYLLAANSMNALNNNLARLLGPPIGGALIGLFGLPSIVLLNGASFLVAAALISTISVRSTRGEGDHAPPDAARGWTGFWREWAQGLGLIGRGRLLAVVFCVAGIVTLAGGMFDVLLVAFVSDVLGGEALTFGWLLTARGAGGLLGGIVIAQRHDPRRLPAPGAGSLRPRRRPHDGLPGEPADAAAGRGGGRVPGQDLRRPRNHDCPAGVSRNGAGWLPRRPSGVDAGAQRRWRPLGRWWCARAADATEHEERGRHVHGIGRTVVGRH